MSNTKIDSKYKTMFSDYPDVVTVVQLRKMLGISRHLAYELICEKKIKAFQLGNSYKIPKPASCKRRTAETNSRVVGAQ